MIEGDFTANGGTGDEPVQINNCRRQDSLGDAKTQVCCDVT